MSDSDLRDFVTSVSGDAYLSIEENLGDGFVRLRTAEAERRQAKHDIRCVEDIVIEMLRNARDAHARNVYIAISREKDDKTLVFLDDGDGVPEFMQDKIFESRVTSKLESMVMDRWGVHGRGMALYSIRQNASLAEVVTSNVDAGSSFRVVVDLQTLDEKADQSTYPKLIRNDEGRYEVARGPHNVLRTAVEFALESRERVTVYIGSPTSIIARLVKNGRRNLSDDQLLFCDSPLDLPVCDRPAAAVDALDLVEISESIGCPIGERSAHRVIAGQIQPASSVLSNLIHDTRRAEPKPADIYKDGRGLKISQEDLYDFEKSLEHAFEKISQRYYVHLSDNPSIRVGKDAITVKFPIDKEL